MEQDGILPKHKWATDILGIDTVLLKNDIERKNGKK